MVQRKWKEIKNIVSKKIRRIRRENTDLSTRKKFPGKHINNRSANYWNPSWLSEVLNAKTVNSFKACLDFWINSKQGNRLSQCNYTTLTGLKPVTAINTTTTTTT